MKTSLMQIGVSATLAATLGLAQAQSTITGPGAATSPSGAGTGAGTVSPSGTLTPPGSIVTPGGPTVSSPRVPSVPSTTAPPLGASSPTNPEAGSLSGTVDQRNRSARDTPTAPIGNGTYGPMTPNPGVNGSPGSLSPSGTTGPSNR